MPQKKPRVAANTSRSINPPTSTTKLCSPNTVVSQSNPSRSSSETSNQPKRDNAVWTNLTKRMTVLRKGERGCEFDWRAAVQDRLWLLDRVTDWERVCDRRWGWDSAWEREWLCRWVERAEVGELADGCKTDSGKWYSWMNFSFVDSLQVDVGQRLICRSRSSLQWFIKGQCTSPCTSRTHKTDVGIQGVLGLT